MDIPLHPSIQMAIGLLPIVWLLVAVVVRPQAGGRRREAAWQYCPVAAGDRGPGPWDADRTKTPRAPAARGV